MDPKSAVDTVLQWFASDFIRHQAGVPELQRGTESFDKYMHESVLDISDFRATLEDMVGEGDKVAVRVTARFKQKSSGKYFTGSSIWIARFSDDKIAEVWACETIAD